jgi:hypothetical protein
MQLDNQKFCVYPKLHPENLKAASASKPRQVLDISHFETSHADPKTNQPILQKLIRLQGPPDFGAGSKPACTVDPLVRPKPALNQLGNQIRQHSLDRAFSK